MKAMVSKAIMNGKVCIECRMFRNCHDWLRCTSAYRRHCEWYPVLFDPIKKETSDGA